MHGREIHAISNNLLEAMRFFGRARHNGQVEECPGVCMISCGINYAAFNAAVLSSPAGPNLGELRGRIEVPARHFGSRNLRWTYWLCDDYLETAVRRECRATFSRFGLSLLTDPPGMFAAGLLPPSRPLPEIEVRQVRDEPTRLAFSNITSLAFEIPYSICREIYGAERAWAGKFQGYVGYADGSPIATSATVVTDDVVGVYSVATLPNKRRGGYAEAIMRAAVGSVKESTGISASVLQATASGYSLYERMGYRKMTKFSVFIS